MIDSRPLSITVRPANRMLVADFVTNARHVLSADDRFHIQVVDGGLLISCLWHPDLSAAYDLLDRHDFRNLLWGDPVINLKRETVEVNGMLRERVLEPILLVEVESPDQFIGNVIGDLSSRRGLVTGQRTLESGSSLTSAEVPLSELSRYAEDLAKLTNGTGCANARFLKYDHRPYFQDPPPDEPMSAALRA